MTRQHNPHVHHRDDPIPILSLMNILLALFFVIQPFEQTKSPRASQNCTKDRQGPDVIPCMKLLNTGIISSRRNSTKRSANRTVTAPAFFVLLTVFHSFGKVSGKRMDTLWSTASHDKGKKNATCC